MRGTLSDSSPRARLTGIIPAYAGNTKPMLIWWMSPRDHPRVCGEHRLIGGRRHGAVGSSPRMRGTLGHVHQWLPQLGIIPAYAGNTMIVAVAHVHWWDHPRVCGEHLSIDAARSAVTGSSPRMRGTPTIRGSQTHEMGIIPAYAGNTADLGLSHPTCRDHPRVCGEHTPTGTQAETPTGSSPRMRGTLPKRVMADNLVGIIPAYAGNTLSRSHGVLDRRDHPRVCGEHQNTTSPLTGI